MSYIVQKKNADDSWKNVSRKFTTFNEANNWKTQEEKLNPDNEYKVKDLEEEVLPEKEIKSILSATNFPNNDADDYVLNLADWNSFKMFVLDNGLPIPVKSNSLKTSVYQIDFKQLAEAKRLGSKFKLNTNSIFAHNNEKIILCATDGILKDALINFGLTKIYDTQFKKIIKFLESEFGRGKEYKTIQNGISDNIDVSYNKTFEFDATNLPSGTWTKIYNNIHNITRGKNYEKETPKLLTYIWKNKVNDAPYAIGLAYNLDKDLISLTFTINPAKNAGVEQLTFNYPHSLVKMESISKTLIKQLRKLSDLTGYQIGKNGILISNTPWSLSKDMPLTNLFGAVRHKYKIGKDTLTDKKTGEILKVSVSKAIDKKGSYTEIHISEL